jgi:hypothetical protein
MECCLSSKNNIKEVNLNCPSCGEKGKKVHLITLKSLLKAVALKTIEPENSYAFCPKTECTVVYFSGDHSLIFTENDLKVPVYQKNPSMSVPVCYCFDWTRERLVQTVGTDQKPIDEIQHHIQAGRCGCEVNNPQGACCLGNVSAFLREF